MGFRLVYTKLYSTVSRERCRPRSTWLVVGALGVEQLLLLVPGEAPPQEIEPEDGEQYFLSVMNWIGSLDEGRRSRCWAWVATTVLTIYF